MRSNKSNIRGIAAITAALSLGAGIAFSQENAKADAKKPAKAKTEAGKKSPAPAEAKKAKPKAPAKKSASAEARVEIRVLPKGDDKAPGKPGIVKRHGVQIMRGTHSQGHGEDWKPRPWLGIATRPVPGPVREYLELDEGFGVQVEHVVGKSPADEAGLKVHDIIVHLDDQRVISPEHVALLVRSKKKGAKLGVTFIRKGKEQTTDVTLGERDLPPFSNASMPVRPPHPPMTRRGHDDDDDDDDDDGKFEFRFGEPGKEGHFGFRLPGDAKDHEELRGHLKGYGEMIQEWMKNNPDMRNWNWKREGRGDDASKPREPKATPPGSGAGHFGFQLPGDAKDHEELRGQLKGYGEMIKEWMEKNPDMLRNLNRNWQGRGDDAPKPKPQFKPREPKTTPPDSDAAAATKPKPIPPLPGKSAQGRPPSIMVRPGFPLQVFGGAGVVKIDNTKGAVTITATDGDHKITIKNSDGETVYEGAYDADKGPKGLPKEAQAQLKVMKLDDLKLLMPRASIGGPKPGAPSSKPKYSNKEKGTIL